MSRKIIIFDFDGTLCDTRKNIIIAFRATMERLGLDMRDEATCGATIGLTLHDGFKAMYPTMSDAEAAHCVDTYREIFAERRRELIPPLFPNVREVLTELHARGFILTIASSRLYDSIMLFLREHGIEELFSYVVGSDSVTHHKPHPEPVLMTLKALDVSADDAIVVGDMPLDVAMGRGAGVRTVAVTYGNATREELEAAEADFVIDSFDMFIGCIERVGWL